MGLMSLPSFDHSCKHWSTQFLNSYFSPSRFCNIDSACSISFKKSSSRFICFTAYVITLQFTPNATLWVWLVCLSVAPKSFFLLLTDWMSYLLLEQTKNVLVVKLILSFLLLSLSLFTSPLTHQVFFHGLDQRFAFLLLGLFFDRFFQLYFFDLSVDAAIALTVDFF